MPRRERARPRRWPGARAGPRRGDPGRPRPSVIRRLGPMPSPASAAAVRRREQQERQPLALRAVDEDPERVVAGRREGQVPEVDRERQRPRRGRRAGCGPTRLPVAPATSPPSGSSRTNRISCSRSVSGAVTCSPMTSARCGWRSGNRRPPIRAIAAAEDVELLAGDGLGGVGKEGEVDVGHRAYASPRRGPRQRAPSPRPLPACADGVPAGHRRGRGAVAVGPSAAAPASSANVTSESGTSGSPRRTRARYSPVAEPLAVGDLSRACPRR